jgi:glutathione synthase/RimK-type ligase-like ATP-grasp enzyme
VRIAYLACARCLPDAVNRRPDAYEHDREVAALRPAVVAMGGELVEVDWRFCDPAQFDLALVRTTWDYVERQDEFLAFLDRAARLTRLANSRKLIAWNLSKRYLVELLDAGLPVIPSFFTDAEIEVASIFDALSCEELVLKPVVGAGGFGQSRIARGNCGKEVMSPGQFAQPLIPEIETWGEVSMVFIDSLFCHAVRKVPAAGEYRIQVIHGGSEVAYAPSAEEIAAAQAFIDALPTPALAARVDMVPHRGQLLLMELEVIEPHLFPTFGPDLGPRLATACARLIDQTSINP